MTSTLQATNAEFAYRLQQRMMPKFQGTQVLDWVLTSHYGTPAEERIVISFLRAHGKQHTMDVSSEPNGMLRFIACVRLKVRHRASWLQRKLRGACRIEKLAEHVLRRAAMDKLKSAMAPTAEERKLSAARAHTDHTQCVATLLNPESDCNTLMSLLELDDSPSSDDSTILLEDLDVVPVILGPQDKAWILME